MLLFSHVLILFGTVVTSLVILGIGVDDMFILLSGVADALYDGDTRSRIGQMMRRSGVAITITSLTDILAFGAGASSTFKSVRNFCVFTGNDKNICHFMRKKHTQIRFKQTCTATAASKGWTFGYNNCALFGSVVLPVAIYNSGNRFVALTSRIVKYVFISFIAFILDFKLPESAFL